MASDKTWSKAALLNVARGQKNVLWLILISLIVLIPGNILLSSMRNPEVIKLIQGLVTLLLGIAQVVAVWKLAQAIRSSVPWLYCLLAFIPCISLISLLILNQNATKVLNANGVKVGFMGADTTELEKQVFGSDEDDE